MNMTNYYACDGADGYDGINVYSDDSCAVLIDSYPYERTGDDDTDFVERAKNRVSAKYNNIVWAKDDILDCEPINKVK